jgi:hypothetical protein
MWSISETGRSANWASLIAILTSVAACGGGGDALSTGMGTGTEVETSEVTTAHRLAGGTEKTVYKQKLANASFTNSLDGCVSTYLTISATTEKLKANGTASVVPTLQISGETYDYCQNVFVDTFFGQANTVNINISKDLSVAKVKGSVELLYNVSGARKTFAVDLQWIGGPLITDPETKVITITPTSRAVVITSNGARVTQSLTGSMTRDGVDLLDLGTPASFFSFASGVVANGARIEKTGTR